MGGAIVGAGLGAGAGYNAASLIRGERKTLGEAATGTAGAIAWGATSEMGGIALAKGAEMGYSAFQAWRAGRAAARARGANNTGGVFTTTVNSAGGRVVTSVGEVTGAQVGTQVNTALYAPGEIRVLTGAHGTATGQLIPEAAFLADDMLKFGGLPGVVVRDVTTMTSAEIAAALQAPGTTIGAFCNSAICLRLIAP